MAGKQPEDSSEGLDEQQIDDEFDQVQAEFEAAIDLAKQVKEEAGIEIKDHIAPDHDDQCGYCGQCFGPDDIVVEKKIYERNWKFCDDECYNEFMDASNFKDENLDAGPDIAVNIKKED